MRCTGTPSVLTRTPLPRVAATTELATENADENSLAVQAQSGRVFTSQAPFERLHELRVPVAQRKALRMNACRGAMRW